MLRRVLWLLLLLPWLTGGCTCALWQKNRLDAYNKPAPQPHLHLYQAVERHDVLAVYDEFSERDGSHQPRAYYLYLNDRRVEHGQKPWFVTTNLARQFPPVPILPKPPEPGTNAPDELYAVLSTNQIAFTLFSGPRPVSSHHLPHYPDAIGDVERVALTPLAVSVDTTLLELWLFCVAAANQDDPAFLDGHSGSHGHHGPHPHDTDQASTQTTSPTPGSPQK